MMKMDGYLLVFFGFLLFTFSRNDVCVWCLCFLCLAFERGDLIWMDGSLSGREGERSQ